MENKQPHEYICVESPYWCTADVDDENEDDEDEEDDGEQRNKVEMFPKPAEEHPEWKWIMMWQSWTSLTDYMTRASYTDPDLFDMYIYNDFHWYGLAELIENLLAEFEKAKTKHAKAKDIATLYDIGDASSFQMMDDGARTSELIGLIGCASVTMLDTLDKGGELKDDSKFRDLGLVISLFLKWSQGQEDSGITEEDLELGPLLITYAKNAGIDLEAVGCNDIGEILDQLDGESDVELPKSKADRYQWAKTLKDYKKQHTAGNKLGGESYNILKMSRKERAGYAFEKKDPLAQFSDKDLREGNLALGPA